MKFNISGLMSMKPTRCGSKLLAFAKVEDKQTALTTKLASDEELLQTLLTRLPSSDAKNKGGRYMGQLAYARARVAQAATVENMTASSSG